MSSELKLRSIGKTQKILASPFWAFFVGPFLYKPIYKSFLLGQGKIYSYSEQAESINKDCCNSQSSPGRHSPKQFSAKDSNLFYIFWSISYFPPTVFDRGSSQKTLQALLVCESILILKTWAEWYYSIRWPQCDGGSTKPYATCQEEVFKLV